MPALTIDLPEVSLRRLEALAAASGKSVDELVREALDTPTGSFRSRRAILKARGAAASGAKPSLADLGWLDGYAGQTVDQLLSFESTELPHEILFALQGAIQQKVAEAGRAKLTGVERMVLSVLALQREVNNGGYDQFFLNSSREFAPFIVADLVRIGCTEMADLTQEAIDASALTDAVARERALERCDIRFYGKPSPSAALLAYVKAHADGIRI